jgi:pimeloyl-ACP methyl ester carboxylesterase
MKRTSVLVVLSFICMSSALAQRVPRNFPADPRLARKLSVHRAALTARVAPVLPAAASANVVQATCPVDIAGLVCGYVNVPLDWEHPKGAKIGIYFELLPHSNPGPADSAILMNLGGPGIIATSAMYYAQYLFAPNLDVHDVLLIDDRGTGLSSAIDCTELQHGTGPFDESVANCAKQLGVTASRYGDADIARDADAVRAALGYEFVDYLGASYGGLNVSGYATRFGQHLRSVVLDAPFGTPALEPFAIEHFRATSDRSVVKLDCQRSPTCSIDHPNPASEFYDLVEDVREHPFEGDGHDADGNVVHVQVNEKALLNNVVHGYIPNYAAIGELLAAQAALEGGDRTPLLRLAAEGFSDFVGDYGDPTYYSQGDVYARGCVNAQQAWNWWEPISARQERYAEAVADLPAEFFGPFSKDAATGIVFSHLGRRCLYWENPDPSSVTPRHAIYPHVPTLVLEGDLDNRVPLEETNKVAALFPKSIAVTIPESGHETLGYSQCAANLMNEFIETLHVADVSCANSPAAIFPAVGRFTLLASQARPAAIDGGAGNQIGLSERKVVTVSVAAATDALQRLYLNLVFGYGSGNGAGLRSGTFQTDFSGSSWVTTLTNCSFATDVVVNGTVSWDYFVDSSMVADLVVSGPGTAGGTLHVEGIYQGAGPVGNFKVSGTLGGHKVATLVPEG